MTQRRSSAEGDGPAAAVLRVHPAAEPADGVQGVLFEPEPPDVDEEQIGYRGPTACAAVGISYRQLDYWARTGLVVPSVRDASGSGTHRLYSFRDVLVLRVVKSLLDAGVSLQNIRAAVDHLRERGVADLSGLTLISDGSTVYECTSPDEIVDLLRGGQGVFGIAVGSVVREVEGSLATLPAERAGGAVPDADVTPHPGDELASRRRRRSTA